LMIPSEGFELKTLLDICEQAVTKRSMIANGANHTPNSMSFENFDWRGFDDFTSMVFNELNWINICHYGYCGSKFQKPFVHVTPMLRNSFRYLPLTHQHHLHV
jgi:hypothetical protein